LNFLAKHFFLTTNPLNLSASNQQLDEGKKNKAKKNLKIILFFTAKKIVEEYRHGFLARPTMTFDELWSAKYLYDRAFHPDTKEKMFILGRMSAQGLN
jgi:hypothetical protein